MLDSEHLELKQRVNYLEEMLSGVSSRLQIISQEMIKNSRTPEVAERILKLEKEFDTYIADIYDRYLEED
jgi:archaellum component FlaC